MVKRVLLGIMYGALGIALSVALTLSAFELAGRNLSSTTGSADVRLVGEDVRPPHAHHRQDRSHHSKHENRPGHPATTPTTAPPEPTVAQATSGTGTTTRSGPRTAGGDHPGAGGSDSATSGDHDHEHNDD